MKHVLLHHRTDTQDRHRPILSRHSLSSNPSSSGRRATRTHLHRPTRWCPRAQNGKTGRGTGGTSGSCCLQTMLTRYLRHSCDASWSLAIQCVYTVYRSHCLMCCMYRPVWGGGCSPLFAAGGWSYTEESHCGNPKRSKKDSRQQTSAQQPDSAIGMGSAPLEQKRFLLWNTLLEPVTVLFVTFPF